MTSQSAACGSPQRSTHGASENAEPPWPLAAAQPARYVATNATVYTVDADQPTAEAFAVEDGRFVAVGTEAALTAAYPDWPTLDMDERTVVPGLIDAHAHLMGLGEALLVELATGALEAVSSTSVSLKAGAGVISPFCAGSHADVFDAACKPLAELSPKCSGADGKTGCMLTLDAIDSGGATVTHNLVAMAPPKSLALPNASVTAKATDADNAAVVHVEATGGTALYVVLTTELQGRFSDNAFLLLPHASRTIDFLPFEGFKFAELQSTLRVEHVASYM